VIHAETSGRALLVNRVIQPVVIVRAGKKTMSEARQVEKNKSIN